MKSYDHKKIEKKWQIFWEKKGIYHAKDFSKKPKYYSLIEFPYPSGDGLHVGHPRPYIGMDVISRKRRLENFNVLYPIGWDAFGLPTENYAIKTGIQPSIVTKKNTDIFRRQIKSLGISFDWSREVNTTDPKYYKWTQWIFLQFLKKGLAYKVKMAINWCPKDKIGLANEEVIGGCCERCGTPVEKREKEQWMLAITKYADRLDKDLDTVDYSQQIKLAQRNWIGRSEGAEVEFKIVASSAKNFLETAPSEAKGQGTHTFLKNSLPATRGVVKVFTTRPDTIFGATYLVLAPEHELVQKLKLEIKNWSEVENYIKKVKKETEIERTAEDKIKTGVELKGIKAINPANKEEISIWIADYVLATYGTGAIMAVPAHDERDFEFAKKYDLEIKNVVIPVRIDEKNPHVPGKEIVFRNIVMAVVKNPKNEKYLVLEVKNPRWTTFVIGGIEKGEDPEAAARREILEESGYKNLKLVRILGGPVHSEFYAGHKGINRVAHNTTVYFELENNEQETLAEEEAAKHSVAWIDFKDITRDRMSHSELDIVLERLQTGNDVYTGEGILVNSSKFDGMESEKAKKEIIKFVGGKEKTTFRLRDWIFSRQRYWGEPIPVVHCDKCGIVPVPEKDLPVELPKVKNYQPTDSGESPLANISKWVNVKCPKCKSKAKRETDTMPNWAGSSWYYLRYTDPKNSKEFASMKKLKYWLGNDPAQGGVNWYNGGNEHTTLHLLYSRFWHKFLYDLGLVPTSEPYKKRTSHGMILGEGGVKMSKSLGNVINPDEIIKIYGADTLRIYEMFMGPFNQSVAWSTESIIGARRFIEKVWRIGEKVKASSDEIPKSQKNFGEYALGDIGQGTHFSQNPSGISSIQKLLHKTIKKVSEDIEEMHFNTAISSLMILATEMEKSENIGIDDYKKFLQILAPFAPHVTEELWNMFGEKKSINLSSWPKWSTDLIQDKEVKIVVQINGKVRTEIIIEADESEEAVKQKTLANETVLKQIVGRDVKKLIYVKNRLINIVL